MYDVSYLLQSWYIQILLFTAAHSAHRRAENSNSHLTVVIVIYYYGTFKLLSIHPEYSSLINNNVLYNQLLLSVVINDQSIHLLNKTKVSWPPLLKI